MSAGYGAAPSSGCGRAPRAAYGTLTVMNFNPGMSLKSFVLAVRTVKSR
jgi:hypothetical protein